jgi:hypothetical protein
MASFNLNNIYPKPTIYRGTPAYHHRLVMGSGAPVSFLSFADTTNMVMFDIQDSDVICTLDGTFPSVTNGHKLYQGRAYTWSAAMAKAAQFVRAGSTTAVIVGSELQM